MDVMETASKEMASKVL